MIWQWAVGTSMFRSCLIFVYFESFLLLIVRPFILNCTCLFQNPSTVKIEKYDFFNVARHSDPKPYFGCNAKYYCASKKYLCSLSNTSYIHVFESISASNSSVMRFFFRNTKTWKTCWRNFDIFLLVILLVRHFEAISNESSNERIILVSSAQKCYISLT